MLVHSWHIMKKCNEVENVVRISHTLRLHVIAGWVKKMNKPGESRGTDLLKCYEMRIERIRSFPFFIRMLNSYQSQLARGTLSLVYIFFLPNSERNCRKAACRNNTVITRTQRY